MTKTKWFTVSGLDVSVAHNVKTKEVWDSLSRSKKSDYARRAIIEFATAQGFYDYCENQKCVQDAFNYLLGHFKGATKSYVIRSAIENYSSANANSTT